LQAFGRYHEVRLSCLRPFEWVTQVVFSPLVFKWLPTWWWSLFSRWRPKRFWIRMSCFRHHKLRSYNLLISQTMLSIFIKFKHVLLALLSRLILFFYLIR
jgi:hypothetical protein